MAELADTANSNIPPSTLLRNDQPMLVMDVLHSMSFRVPVKWQNRPLTANSDIPYYLCLLPCYITTDLC
jgi:hypothetical protein